MNRVSVLAPLVMIAALTGCDGATVGDSHENLAVAVDEKPWPLFKYEIKATDCQSNLVTPDMDTPLVAEPAAKVGPTGGRQPAISGAICGEGKAISFDSWVYPVENFKPFVFKESVEVNVVRYGSGSHVVHDPNAVPEGVRFQQHAVGQLLLSRDEIGTVFRVGEEVYVMPPQGDPLADGFFGLPLYMFAETISVSFDDAFVQVTCGESKGWLNPPADLLPACFGM